MEFNVYSPDFGNGLVELLGALFGFNSCRQVYLDKAVKGVSTLSVTFFTLWGYWNIYYYSSLNQWFSFFGGLALAMANSLYVIMLLYYLRKNNLEAP